MTDKVTKQTKQQITDNASQVTDRYNPFEHGSLPVGVLTLQAHDTARDRLFPCEIWYPATEQLNNETIEKDAKDSFEIPIHDAPMSPLAVRDAAPRRASCPLIIYSHPSGGNRCSATFLCTHLSSHGYVAAALDHSELVAPELARKDDETGDQKAARIKAWIANRVPDIRFLIDHMLNHWSASSGIELDRAEVGIVGHSFGGWTALAAVEAESRIGAVVALAPGGSSKAKPGILPVILEFRWGRDVPTMYLVAENDVSLPVVGMYELFDRTPSTKQMAILRRADHLHFMDNVEVMHEAVRKMAFGAELAWINKEMRPISELCSGDKAHQFVRGLTLCHLDAVLRKRDEARQYILGDLKAELSARGIDAILHKL